jgi:hypothetical protein
MLNSYIEFLGLTVTFLNKMFVESKITFVTD